MIPTRKDNVVKNQRNTAFVLFVLFIIFISIIGCTQKDEMPEEATEATVEVIPVDITVEAPLLKIGFVKQDHHSAVFVSALRSEEMSKLYSTYLIPMGEQFYALIDNGVKVAEIEFIQSQGAINVPNNMVAGLFDIGFGGVIPFAASADKESGVKIISPLHTRGDMLVVPIELETVNDWDSFIAWVESSDEPIIIGFKSPKAVALLIFESALTEVGISWSMLADPQPGSQVLLSNVQGQPNLNPALQNGIIDAYVSNNPACAMAEHNEIGKCVAELSDLPPGDFLNHPCCAIAATTTAIAEKADEIVVALKLFENATDYINNNPEDAAAAAAEWIGNPLEVEEISMATSGYDMTVTEDWLGNMHLILENMRNLGTFTGPLAEDNVEANSDFLYDFSLLPVNQIITE